MQEKELFVRGHVVVNVNAEIRKLLSALEGAYTHIIICNVTMFKYFPQSNEIRNSLIIPKSSLNWMNYQYYHNQNAYLYYKNWLSTEAYLKFYYDNIDNSSNLNKTWVESTNFWFHSIAEKN